MGGNGVEQLILLVLKLAHEAPLAGHMGRNKTVSRVLQRFYWPNIYLDVAEWCKNCPNCQKAHNKRTLPVPLVPLPVMPIHTGGMRLCDTISGHCPTEIL